MPQIIFESEEEKLNRKKKKLKEKAPKKPSLKDVKNTSEKKLNQVVKSLLSIFIYISISSLYYETSFKFIIFLAGAILFHELGHLTAMKLYGYSNLKVFFIPLVGAFATGKKDVISQKQDSIILLSGPAPGILLGTILYVYATIYNEKDLLLLGDVFLILNLFNLLPIKPLDGGSLTEALFFNNGQNMQLVFLSLSALVMVILTFYLGAIKIHTEPLFITFHFESFGLIIVSCFLILLLVVELQRKKIRGELRKYGIDCRKQIEELTDKEYRFIRETIIYRVSAFYDLNPDKYESSSQEKKMKDYIRHLLEKPMYIDLSKKEKLLFLSIWFFLFILPTVSIGYVQEITK